MFRAKSTKRKRGKGSHRANREKEVELLSQQIVALYLWPLFLLFSVGSVRKKLFFSLFS